MFHVAAYFGSLGNTADTDVAAVVDDIVTIQNNHFVLSQPLLLVAAQAAGSALVRAKLASPTMRQIASPYVRPILAAVAGGPNPNMWLLDHNPFTIRPFEEVQFQATCGVVGPTSTYGLIWLANQITPIPSGDIIPLRVTSTTAAVAQKWTTAAVTFADTLPSGTYAMVQSECASTTGVAHRWIVPNQLWRPGFPSTLVSGSRLPYAIMKGQWGLMGRFRSNDLPRLQVLCESTDASHECYLHVIRVGDINIPFGPF